MLVIEVEFLSGRYVATAHNDRERAEWPPHPARLFSAMVAAHYESAPSPDRDVTGERRALQRIEAASAPSIEASDVDPDDLVGRRTVSDVYVPVNDTTVLDHRKVESAIDEIAAARHAVDEAASDKDRRSARSRFDKATKRLASLLGPDKKFSDKAVKAARALQPSSRTRQKRTFPSFTPRSPVIRFAWSSLVLDPTEGQALRSLLDRVTRLGHSSSVVRCALVPSAVPTLVPVDSGPSDHTLRVVGPGQLRRLDDAFAVHQAVQPRSLPHQPQRYRVADDDAHPSRPRSVFDGDGARWVVLRLEGPALQATRCVDVAKAVHRSLLAHCPEQPAPELLSGRAEQDRTSERPHLAVVPLPDVGHAHAHGGVLGVALVLPRGTRRGALVSAVAAWEMSVEADAAESPDVDAAPILSLLLGRRGVVSARRIEVPALWGLRARAWCRPSRHWVTATPIALDENPGNLHPRGGTPSERAERAARADAAARDIVARGCERIGLPRPGRVVLSLAPLLAGAAPVRAFDPYPPEPGRLRRVRVHAEITFHEEVVGPVLLGAGRYFGLGLCRPVPGGGS